MADNVNITQGAGTIIAADEVTRNAVVEKQQIIKVSLGADGAFDTLLDSGQQTMANSVPVVLASNQTNVPTDHGVSAAAFDTLAVIAFSSVGAGYGTLITPSGNAREILIYNNTDADIRGSFNGGTTDHWFIPAKTGIILDWATINRFQVATISIKRDSAAPTEGNVYANVVR